jgi:hypothetical protein
MPWNSSCNPLELVSETTFSLDYKRVIYRFIIQNTRYSALTDKMLNCKLNPCDDYNMSWRGPLSF